MFRLSRLATWQVAAIVVITLGIFGPSAIQAQHKHNDNSCEQKACPAPALEKPTVAAPCCPAPIVKECAPPPPAPSCCPVDPKDVRRAQTTTLSMRRRRLAKGNSELPRGLSGESMRPTSAGTKE